MKPVFFLILYFLAFFPATAQNSLLKMRIYLIGDAGEMEDGHHPVIENLKSRIGENPGVPTHLIYLGDNIYPFGLPPKEAKNRPEAETILRTQLNLFADLPGQIWMVPGNHDWEKGKSDGWNAILRAEEFVSENFPTDKVHWVPESACPGPKAIPLDNNTLLITMDSQWWLHSNDKPGTDSDCDYKTEEEIIAAISYLLEENQDKIVLFAMHHPMRAYGPHNGAYSWKDHLFPLTAAKENLYIPLPVLGSIYPLYRTWFGDVQDIPHPKYQAMIGTLERVFARHPHVIQVAGHEHGLFYTREGSNHYIVSGAGAKNTFIKKNNAAAFTYGNQGYAYLDFYENHRVSLTFLDPSIDSPLYQSDLIQPFALVPEELRLFERKNPPSVTQPISLQYQKGKLHRAFLGTNYRDTWAIPVTFPTLDLTKEKGGLTIEQRGGGMQTKSLRAKNPNDREFVLRSINKYPENAIPPPLRQTIAKDVVQDQISASHPYASVAVARLAESAKIIHTNPKIVYLPDDPLLGVFREDFGNALYLFEEREIASPDASDKVKFYSTDKMLKELHHDNDHEVRQKEVLKARLFDLWIADWDRHDDQWRWVAEKGKNGLEFSPMPRDRDQAFFLNEGFFPKIASRKWANPKFQGFGYELKNVNGFMFNGRYFDRSFMTDLDREDWEEEIDELLPKLSEEAIYSAFQDWPKEVRDQDAPVIQAKLLARKTWLKEKALEYYDFLADDVDVVGSNKDEEFEIRHLPDGKVDVEVRKINKDGKLEQRTYNRTFSPEETREIRLYGLKGDDRFIWEGEGNSEILIRVIPGEGDKELLDLAELNGKKHLVYVPKKKKATYSGPNLKIKEAPNPDYLSYDRMAFKYDRIMPLASIEYNQDDGVFLGAGILWEKHGFKKKPYSAMHTVTGNYAVKTGAFNMEYKGRAVDVVRSWDLVWLADVKAPDYVFNYFGAGNESNFNREEFSINYYRSRFSWYELSTGLQTQLGDVGRFAVGPSYQVYRFDPEDNLDKFITSPDSDVDQAELDQTKYYAGVTALLEFDKRDNVRMPTRGYYFRQEIQHFQGINQFAKNYSAANTELRLYWAFKYPSKMVWANRVGGGKNFGSYEYFQGQILGGMNNLRGFRRYRYNGDAVFYNNLEFRLQLLNLQTPILPATVGMIGFYDVGRVWLKGEDSGTWHNSLGGGLWIAPVSQFVATFSVGFTKEETLPFFSFGYQF
ncbi:metallophosphoesterase [Algoriphagus jejuensis]|uniref:Metallophosphoesterase n=1 Tax=Algoriphagus jejuensis TaxID=419934 RepID=A0ABP3YG61_9BACT